MAGRSAAYLRKLRKKYGLGEFSRRRRGRAGGRRLQSYAGPVQTKGKPKKKPRPPKVPFDGTYGRVRLPFASYPEGSYGYPGTSDKENFLRSIAVDEITYPRGPIEKGLNRVAPVKR